MSTSLKQTILTESIKDMLAEYSYFAASKSARGVAGLYTKTAQVVMPNALWNGRKQIEACLAYEYSQDNRPRQEIDLERIDLDTGGTCARVTEKFTLHHNDGTIEVGLATMFVARIDGEAKILGEFIVTTKKIEKSV